MFYTCSSLTETPDKSILSYFDLFLIHFPVALKYVDYTKFYPTGWTYKDENGNDHGVKPANVPIRETWEAMEDLVTKKLARSIGVSNFQGSLLMDVLRFSKVPVSVLQIEHHPYLAQPNLISLAKQEGIAVTAYSSFGPQSFIELGWEKAKKLQPLFQHPLVVSIAKAHNRSPAQVLLRWSTQRGIAIIPKSNSTERLQENLDSLNFELTQKEIDDISGLDENIRFNEPVDVSSKHLVIIIISWLSLVPWHSSYLCLSWLVDKCLYVRYSCR
jgi:D-xylose reductase